MNTKKYPSEYRVKVADRAGTPENPYFVFSIQTYNDKDIYQVDYSPEHISPKNLNRHRYLNVTMTELTKLNLNEELDRQRKKLHGEANSAAHQVKIVLPPGHRLISLTSMLLDKKRYRRFIYPHVADMHLEYFEALKNGNESKARIVVILFYLRVLTPVVRAIFTSIKTWFEFTSK